MLKKIIRILRNINKREIKQSNIDVEELKLLEKQGGIIIDVRSPQEYKEGHLNGAILLPEYEIKEKAKEILTNKQKAIIVYCNTGTRSKKAQKELIKMGYEAVYNLYKGLENY